MRLRRVHPAIETIATYLIRVAPSLLLGATMLVLFRRNARGRMVVYLALFVLLRDSMSPLGLWSFGSEGGFWIRLPIDPWFLVAFGVSSLVVSLALVRFDRDLRAFLRWTEGGAMRALAWGIAGALCVASPLALAYRFTPIEARGGLVPLEHGPALLMFALLGNLFEELLFRGYVFGHLEQRMSPIRAGVWSGVVFAFCHMYLATTVTNVGYPLLVFTLWEGVIAGLARAKAGLVASTLTHGGAIFLLSSGWL
jgi:membrane protease YdiL (CAAX protease family)